MQLSPLIDGYGRVHTSLRVSVTDRCNIRCFYCMPNEHVQFKPRHELLTFEEITRFVGAATQVGINQIRLTGGEPLLRQGLPELVRQLLQLPGVDDLALTTNGILLNEQAQPLRAAGLQRINISLDGLREETFQAIARRPGLDRVLNGIEAARTAGFHRIRLNAVAIRNLSEAEIIPLVKYATERDMEMRFIEFMPLDAEHGWEANQVLSGAEIRARIVAALGALEPVVRDDPSQPSVDYRLLETGGIVGFINPVTEPFCGDCNRIRLTAEGQLRNCLFSQEEWDARALLRSSATDAELVYLLRACVAAKKPGHGIDSPDFVQPVRAMYQIGG